VLRPAVIPDSPEAFEHALRAALTEASGVFVLGDENTLNHCWPEVAARCPEIQGSPLMEIEPGEAFKCWEVAGHLLETLAEYRADRQALLICLGGGVVTDLGGFVASVYKRGIAALHLPTSLMGQVDAAIGGKTGIDLEGLKNAVGTFRFPKEVIVWPQFLTTLPEEEMRSGMAEMLKHGLIADPGHWKEVLTLRPTNIAERPDLIERSLRIKEDIVRNDPHETGQRALLNLGHTMGHALEAEALQSGHPVSHGSAVAWGIMAETRVALAKGLIAREEAEEIITALEKIFGKPSPEILRHTESLLGKIINDKKNRGGEVRATLPTAIGSASFGISVSEEEWMAALEGY
jgi:3-dehydroquinate synthase